MGTFTSSVDLAIIGAGASGLSAAIEARRLGLRAVVLEAKGRTGGRAFTDRSALGVPFDRGAFWLHSADVNPLTRFALAWGFHLRLHRRTRQIHLGHRWASAKELRERTAFFDRNDRAILAAGRQGLDIPASRVIETGSRWSPLLHRWIAATSGADPEQASTLDLANYRDTEKNWPLREGMGTLIERLGEGLPVTLRTPVRRVAWGGRTVRLETAQGDLRARAAVVTVSTGVLASGLIRFDPALPERKLAAVHGIPMGRANKIAFAFDRNVFGLPAQSSATLLSAAPDAIMFQIRPFGWNVAIGYVGGSLCSELERAGEAAMADLGLAQLKTIFGSDVARRLTRTACTGWEGDRYIRGGYSAAKPGHAHRRADLAEPLADRLFFAGEAASQEFFSTVHGAYRAGVDAVRAAARAIKKSRRTQGAGTAPGRLRTFARRPSR